MSIPVCLVTQLPWKCHSHPGSASLKSKFLQISSTSLNISKCAMFLPIQARAPAPNYGRPTNVSLELDTAIAWKKRLAHSEKIPPHFFELVHVGLNPPLRPEIINVIPKYVLVAMQHPCVDSYDCALWKVETTDCVSAGRHMAFEYEAYRRVDAEGFVDDCRAILWRTLEGARILRRRAIAEKLTGKVG